MGVAIVFELTMLHSVISCPLRSLRQTILDSSLVPFGRLGICEPQCSQPLALWVAHGIRNHSYDLSQRKESPISGGLSSPAIPRLLGKCGVLPSDVPAQTSMLSIEPHTLP